MKFKREFIWSLVDHCGKIPLQLQFGHRRMKNFIVSAKNKHNPPIYIGKIDDVKVFHKTDSAKIIIQIMLILAQFLETLRIYYLPNIEFIR